MASPNPLDPSNVQQVNALLTDLANKIDGIREKSGGALQFNVAKITDVSSKLDKAGESADKLSKFWKTGGENLKKLNEAQKEHTRALKKSGDEIRRLQEEYKKLQTKRASAVAGSPKEKQYEEAMKKNRAAFEKQRKYGKKVGEELKLMNTGGKFKAGLHAAGSDAIDGAMKMGKAIADMNISLFTGTLMKLQDVIKGTFTYAEKWTRIFGQMSRALGAGTEGVQEMQQEAKKLFFGSWGDLGVSADESAKKVTELATGFGYNSEEMRGMTKNLGNLAISLNLADGEIGDFMRSMKLMGAPLDDGATLLLQMEGAAKAAGVPTAALAKEFVVAGKNMRDWVGPKMQNEMKRWTAEAMKMGVSIQSLEGFTKLTDVFDSTADSVAKLNTVFGLHMNAMEMFLEDDPIKRIDMISDAFREQGRSLDSLSRQEKTMLQQTTGLSQRELNAILTNNDGLQSRADILKKIQKEEEEKAVLQEKADKGMRAFGVTLLNIERITDRLADISLRFLKPFLSKMNIGENFENLSDVATKMIDKFSGFIDRIAPSFEKIFEKAAGSFKSIAESVESILTSKGFEDLIITLGQNVAGWLKSLEEVFKNLDSNKGALFGFFDMIIEKSKTILKTWITAQGIMGGAQIGAVLGGPTGALIGAGIGAAAGYVGSNVAMGDSVMPGFLMNPLKEAKAVADSQAAAQGGEHRAVGGPIHPGQVYQVGERGPETFVSGVPGNIVPNGGGGDTIVQVILDGEKIQEYIAKSAMRRFQ